MVLEMVISCFLHIIKLYFHNTKKVLVTGLKFLREIYNVSNPSEVLYDKKKDLHMDFIDLKDIP